MHFWNHTDKVITGTKSRSRTMLTVRIGGAFGEMRVDNAFVTGLEISQIGRC